jgi:hypothetical protein
LLEVPVAVTVNTAVATVPPDCAEMVVVPAPVAVARPEELMAATWTLLELHWTCPERFWEAPPVRLPVAMNWMVSPRNVAAAPVDGVIVINGEPDPEPELGPETVTSELAVMPSDVALMIVCPAESPVTSPVLLIEAIDALTTDQLTELVMSAVVGIPEPIWLAPYALNCAV